MTKIDNGAPPARTPAEREKRLGVLEKALGVVTTAADWGVSSSGFDTDLKLSAVPLGLSAAVGLSLIDGTPTYERCTNDTIQYQLLSTPEQIEPGAAFCVKTGKQRVAGVVIQSVRTGLVSISITQTVWG